MKWTCTPCAPRPTTSQPAPCPKCCGYRDVLRMEPSPQALAIARAYLGRES